MVDYADAVIIIWDGISKGAIHTLNLAVAKGLEIVMYTKKERGAVG